MNATHKIELIKGDITSIPADAIVNAANSSLMGGGGVDGAIHRAGGPDILIACKQLVQERHGGCAAGHAVITTAGKLPAKYVIHTVGPVWGGGYKGEPEILSNCYKNSLQLAIDNGCKTISFPNISTGVYRFPKEDAARIAIDTVIAFLQEHDAIDKVLFVCYETDNFQYMKDHLDFIENHKIKL